MADQTSYSVKLENNPVIIGFKLAHSIDLDPNKLVQMSMNGDIQRHATQRGADGTAVEKFASETIIKNTTKAVDKVYQNIHLDPPIKENASSKIKTITRLYLTGSSWKEIEKIAPLKEQEKMIFVGTITPAQSALRHVWRRLGHFEIEREIFSLMTRGRSFDEICEEVQRDTAFVARTLLGMGTEISAKLNQKHGFGFDV